MTKILVAGIGNELFGDDGFGIAVVERLCAGSLEETSRQRGVELRLMNAGTRGFDLVSALLDGCDAAILIDAAPRGRPPGTLYVLDPSEDAPNLEPGLDLSIDPHRLEPARALSLARATGAALSRVRVVACEPSPALEMSDQLSTAVRAAIEPALSEVERLVAELSRPELADA
ncbi:MAG TPA: hydrogenase maturation protease [Polyangiaceae bacterium]|jgi:hydrogenase maturation protease